MAEEKESKPKKWYQKWWFFVIAVFLVLVVIGSMGEDKSSKQASQPSKETASQQPQEADNKPKQLKNLGDEGYLRYPDSNDSEAIVILTADRENYKQVVTAGLSGDTLGILEIPGAFGVSVGTQVKIIDTDVGVKRVRILDGATDVDDEKIGRTGWTASEWVVNQ